MADKLSVLRAYPAQNRANKGKDEAVAALLPHWQNGMGQAQRLLLREFHTTGNLPKYPSAVSKNLVTALSARQNEAVTSQAGAALASWLGLCKREFRKIVLGSSMPGHVIAGLLYVNAANAWCWTVPKDSDYRQMTTSKKLNTYIHKDVFALAKRVFKQVRDRIGTPDLSHVRTMAMDGKVAQVSLPSSASLADYWVRVSTAQRGRPVQIPLLATGPLTIRKQREQAKVSNFCQVRVGQPDKKGVSQVTYSLVVRSPVSQPVNEGRELGLDYGWNIMFATSDGELLGRSFYAQLLSYDARLRALTSALGRNRVKYRDSRRYRELTQDIREYITNEVNRVLNRLTRKGDIKRIVVENLDFRGGGLSKQMRRIMSNCGRGAISKKLESLSEDKGVRVDEVNPAYTSQQCGGCGFTHKTNRSRRLFRCKFCGRKTHADIGASRTVLKRFQNGEQWLNITKEQILANLDHDFRSRWGLSFSEVVERVGRGSGVGPPSTLPSKGWAAEGKHEE